MSDVITGTKVRLSYCNLLEPRAQDSKKPEDKTYSSAILIPKSDTATVDAIKAAIKEALDEGIVKKWHGKRPDDLRNPLRDGDKKTLKDSADPDPVYADHWFINAKGPYAGRDQAILMDKTGAPTSSAAVVYSGVYGYAKLNFFAYDSNGNKGVGAGISSFMSSGEGDPLSSVETIDTARAAFADKIVVHEASAEFAATEGATEATSAPATEATSADDDPWV